MNSYRNTLITAAVATLTLLGAAQAQDKVNVPLDDPARPAVIKLGQVAGSITVKGYAGKDVTVEAHARNEERRGRRDRDDDTNTQGMKRITVGSTGLEIDEENNEVRISTASHMRPIDVTINVPSRANLKLSTVTMVTSW